MTERRVTVGFAEGLHARPAAMFVRLAAEQEASVTVRKADAAGAAPVSAASMLGVMALGVKGGEDVVLAADGVAADQALDALEEYLRAG